MQNICFFNSTRFWGGGEKSHFDYALNFRDKHYNVYLVTGKNSPLYKKAKEHKLNVFGFNITNISFLNPFKLIKLCKFFKRNNIDTVFLNSSPDLKTGGIAAKWAKTKYIVYMRGLAVPIKNSLLNKFLLTKVATHVIANSEDTRDSMIKKIKPVLNKKNVPVIYRGINFKEWDSRETKKLSLKENDEIIIGNVGRLVKQKGQKHLSNVYPIESRLKDQLFGSNHPDFRVKYFVAYLRILN